MKHEKLRTQTETDRVLHCLQVPRCCGGFFGEHCKACPGPSGLPCSGNGVCVDGTNGTGVCQCNKGFNGTACEMCEAGKYGVHCDQGMFSLFTRNISRKFPCQFCFFAGIDCTCKNGRCNEGLTGDGTCECDVGWRGVLCDESMTSHRVLNNRTITSLD